MNIINNEKKEEKEKTDITIATINWNVTDKLIRCIDSFLATYKDLNYEWYITDNNSHDMNFDEVIKKYAKYSRLKFIKNDKNEGGRILDKVFDKIKGRYFLILGPDTFQKGKTIETLMRFLDEHPIAGMASANQLNPDGSVLLYYNTLWNMKKFFFVVPKIIRWIDYLFFSNKLSNFYINSYFKFDKEGLIEIEQVPYPCMIIRSELLFKDGYILDHNFPFYFNDVDLCKRVWDNGYKIYLVPEAKIIHDHLSSFRKVKRDWATEENQKSLIQFFRKYYKHKIWIVKFIYIINTFTTIFEDKVRGRKVNFNKYIRNIQNYLNW